MTIDTESSLTPCIKVPQGFHARFVGKYINTTRVING